MPKFNWLMIGLIGAGMSAAACDDDTTGEEELPSEIDNSGRGGGGAGGSSRAGSGGSGGRGGSGGSAVAEPGGAAGTGGGGRLQSGTYEVSNIKKITDECGLTLEEPGAFTTTQIANTGTELSIGRRYDDTTDPEWDPPNYAQGSGPYTTATTATLEFTTRSRIASEDCEWDLKRTTKVTYTGDNAVSIDFVDEEENETEGCAEVFEWTGSCTSHYTFDLKKES